MSYQKMHEHEIDIDDELIKRLIKAQFPQWQGLTIRRIQSSGTDNAIFRLGSDMCLRLPRRPEAVFHIENEHRFLPMLAKHLPLDIPIPLHLGKPDEGYPWHWSILRWIKGENATIAKIKDLNDAAKVLAQFLHSLWHIDLTNGFSSWRSGPLLKQDNETQQALKALHGIIDTNKATLIWQKCLIAQKWSKNPVWVHGDLLPTNLLIYNGQLSAVIDFDLMGVGDPAVDLIPAWCLFDLQSRKIFRQALGVDDATWLRGCGWALSIALIIIPYYRNTNPGLTAIANRMLYEVLNDF